MDRKEENMTLKQEKIIAVIGTFLLAFLFHFLYEWFPNTLCSIFFPVNESIWEHMKLLFTPILTFGIVEFLILKYLHIKTHNYFFFLTILALLSIPFYLLFYLPIYYMIGEQMWFNIALLFLVILLVHIVHYFLIQKDLHFHSNVWAVLLVIIGYIIFGYLTYQPIKSDLFFDHLNEKYGVNTYRI